MFNGFGPQVFEWFAGLEQDNSRQYFGSTRDFYEEHVRGELQAMLEELSEPFGGEVKVFRQHRDLRFTADKPPYKTRTSGVVTGGPAAGAGLHAEISARGLYAGTGYYRLDRDQLERFRAAVADDTTGPALAEAVDAAEMAGLEIDGAVLRTAPRGYPRDHARIHLLRRKSLIAGRRLEGAGAIERSDALGHTVETWAAAAPINAWLEQNVGPAAQLSAPQPGPGSIS